MMKKAAIGLATGMCAFAALSKFMIDRSVMSDKYWSVWNDDAQREIDAGIESSAPSGLR